MSNYETTYTYRAGKKIPLEKRPDQFVVRAMPDRLKEIGFEHAEQVSSASCRVTIPEAELETAMERSRRLAPTHHAYYRTDTGEEVLTTPNILVAFNQALRSDEVDAFAGRYGLIKKTAFGDRDYLFELTNHTGMNPVKLVVKLNEDESVVESAEHDLNQRMKKYQFTVPTDPDYAQQWHLHSRFGHADFDPRSSSRCEDAWQLLNNFGSPDVVVGVADDGCRLDHPDFNGPDKFAGWGYFRGNRLVTQADIDAYPDEMYKPGANHGTSCAGVIAGELDASLTVGAAPRCGVVPIQWESQGDFLLISDTKLLTALDYLAPRIDVMSNSWGAVPDNLWSIQVLNRVRELAQTGGRRGKGIVFLWAAGNENCTIQHTASVDVPYTDGWELQNGSWVWVGVRTARDFENNLVGIPGVMHVAALASTAQRSHYSNYGPGISCCAPTNNVHEYHRISVRGLGVTTTTGSGTGVTERFGGTSSATPLVAGVAALTISANPNLTAIEIVAILKQTASKFLDMGGYPRTPPAIFDPDPSWDISPIAPFDRGEFVDVGDPDGTWSPWFGHGRVDAASAVAEAIRRREDGQEVIRQAATPGVNIPDLNATGIRHTINIGRDAILSSIAIHVDITHTYRGDLRVTVTAPSGSEIVLHDRNGGSADNIQRAYDLSSTPALGVLIGQSIKGKWTLHVQDMAAVDVGRLNRWELEITGNANPVITLEENPGVTIPDNDARGIERTLTVTTGGVLQDIEVELDITHTYIRDLIVALLSPAGTRIPLHERSGGDADNIITTYKTATTLALQSLHGERFGGDWRLHVADLEGLDVGKLNRWALKIIRQNG